MLLPSGLERSMSENGLHEKKQGQSHAGIFTAIRVKNFHNLSLENKMH